MEKEEITDPILPPANVTQEPTPNDQPDSEVIYQLSDIFDTPVNPCSPDSCGNSDKSDKSDDSESSDNSDDSDRADNPDDSDSKISSSAQKEIKRMIDEMGADTLLEIIKDNRNAAIRQIIKEVEASQVRCLPSGDSAAKSYDSIFDLAAQAY